MRAPALALSSLLLAGCPTQPPVCDVKPVPPLEEQPSFWADDSSPALVLLASLQGFSCAGDGPVTESVTGEVLSPSNAPLPVTVEPVMAPGMGTVAGARLIFTPSEGPGVYLATATFLPVGGRPSASLLVANDRRKDPMAFALPRKCMELARLSSGTWICDGEVHRPDGGSSTLFLLPYGIQLAAAGNTLWTHLDTTLRAWRDSDGGMEPLGQYTTGSIDRVLALEDRAVLFSSGSTQIVSAADGGLRLEGKLQVDEPGTVAPTARGGRLYVPRADPLVDPSGLYGHEVCRWGMDPAQGVPDGCQSLKGRLLGGWDGVYVTYSPEAGTLRAWAPGPDGELLLVDSLLVPVGNLTALEPSDDLFAGHWPQLTDYTDAALVVRVRGGKILLEHLSTMPSGLSAQQDATWGLLEDGGMAAWPNLP